MVIGHFDWRVENLAFQDNDISAIYDWDSVCAAPEAVVVGNTAAQFTADWTDSEDDPLPSVGEMRSFVSDYELIRGARFDGADASCWTQRIFSYVPTAHGVSIPI